MFLHISLCFGGKCLSLHRFFYLIRFMNKKVIIPLVVVILALLGGLAWLYFSLQEQKQVNQDMQELAALDKQEMENEYERFALQYSEMKTQINNDSISSHS